jgi:DNA-binding PadR family transcriptional regulator
VIRPSELTEAMWRKIVHIANGGSAFGLRGGIESSTRALERRGLVAGYDDDNRQLRYRVTSAGRDALNARAAQERRWEVSRRDEAVEAIALIVETGGAVLEHEDRSVLERMTTRQLASVQRILRAACARPSVDAICERAARNGAKP